MGNGVPNEGPFQHRQPGAGVIGYRFRYHDQVVTGSAWVESPEITPAAYAPIRAAALQSLPAFATAIASSGWATFFGLYAVDMAEARYGVQDLR